MKFGRYIYLRGPDILETEHPVATLAIEMGMHIVERAVGFTVTDLVFAYTSAVFKHMDYIVLEQEIEHPQYA